MAEEIRNDVQEEEKVEKIDLGASLRKEHKEKKPVNRIRTLVIAVAAIVLVAVLAIVLPQVITPKASDEPVIENLSVNLANYTSEDVARIRVEGENTFTLTREGIGDNAVYHMDKMEDELLNTGSCSSAFIQAATLTADQLVEADAADMSPYGLDHPTALLTVEYNDGNTVELEMGGTLSVTGQVYCRIKGEDDVYAMRRYLHELYGGSVLRYRSLTLPELSTEIAQTRSVIIRRAGEEQIRFMPGTTSNSASSTWMMTEPEELRLDAASISELVEAVANVSLYEYEGRYEDLSQFGLDEPWFEIIISDTEGGKRTLRFGDYNEERSVYYCSLDDSGDVFLVYESYMDMFKDFKVSYYLDMFTNIISINSVDQLELSSGSTSYLLSIDREEQYDENGDLKTLSNGMIDYAETFFVNGKECQEKAFKSVYQAVIGVTISNLADQELVDDAQTPALKVTYTFNTGDEPLTIEYLPYDINNYAVRENGKISLICKRELVDSIMPLAQQLVNGELDVEE